MPYPKLMLIDDFSMVLEEKTMQERVSTRMKINSEHPLFEGHFPQNPVTPGVLMIQVFLEQAQRTTGKKLQLVHASNIKFLTVIEPEKEAVVLLESEIKTDGDSVELIGRALYKQAVSIKLKLTFKTIPT